VGGAGKETWGELRQQQGRALYSWQSGLDVDVAGEAQGSLPGILLSVRPPAFCPPPSPAQLASGLQMSLSVGTTAGKGHFRSGPSQKDQRSLHNSNATCPKNLCQISKQPLTYTASTQGKEELKFQSHEAEALGTKWLPQQ
jgi:hypothetical protein